MKLLPRLVKCLLSCWDGR